MPASNPATRKMIATLGGHALWATVQNRTAHTAPARKAFMERFEREVDPEGVLPPEERAKRAENARKAFYMRLALKSAQARRAKAASRKAEREAAEGQ